MIKVIIERQVAEGLESHYEKAISELLSAMTSAPGYISGESLIDAKRSNHYVVIAKWTTESAWSQWFHSGDRKRLMNAIAPFLQTDEQFTVLKQLSFHKYS